MTLFESARIFNESGQLLSHDSFNELGSPLCIIDERNLKRKLKRHVGRRKHETRRTVDALDADEVVLDLMCLLFPNVEITQELNLLLLGGPLHEDVFCFDEDEMIGVSATKPIRSVLDINLLKFQAALTAMLFNPDNSIQQMPARGTPAKILQKIYFTPQWIAREMLVVIKLDISSQYDRFAVMSTIFRSIPKLRPSILAAAASTSLAIFQHQSLANLVLGDDGKGHVIVKGMIAFLDAALNVIERDTQFNAEVFGETENEIFGAIRELCSQITRSIRLLIRSSPGGRGTSAFNCNQLEKYAEYSNSAEATTYRVIEELVKRMTSFSPTHGENFLRWMLLKWPQRNVQLQVFFVRLTAGLLSHFMLLGLMLPADIVHRTFTRIRACIQSPHFLVAQEACIMCNFKLVSVHLSGNQILREKIASALHANASSHWNKRIREISDECFDMMLDLS